MPATSYNFSFHLTVLLGKKRLALCHPPNIQCGGCQRISTGTTVPRKTVKLTQNALLLLGSEQLQEWQFTMGSQLIRGA